MGRHTPTAGPATSRRDARRDARRRSAEHDGPPRRRPPFVMAISLLLALVVLGASVAGWARAHWPWAAAAVGDCTTLTVAASPEVASIVGKAMATHPSAGTCVTTTVTATTPTAFADRALHGSPSAQVWIPDSTLWVDSLKAELAKRTTPLRLEASLPFAQSPVVLGVPPSIASEANTGVRPWASVVGTQPLTAADPRGSTATVMAFAAVWQQMAALPGGQEAMGKSFFEVVRSALPSADVAVWANKAAADAKLFPASEQQLRAYNSAHPPAAAVRAMTPAEGPPHLDYPVVAVGELSTHQMDAVETLLGALTPTEVGKQLLAAGFRITDRGDEIVPGVPGTLPGTPGATPQLKLALFDQIRADWSRLSHDIRLGVVVDVSGSMAESAGPTSRINLAVQAVNGSLARMNPTSSAGLWIFSTNQMAGGTDYRELLPLQPLGSLADPSSHAAAMASAVNRLPTLLSGDTGLYDTIWAAYQNAQQSVTPDQESLVIVVTDGKNDDPGGGLSEADLVAKLKSAADPAKPVRLVLLGIGAGPDQNALATVAQAAGGSAQVAVDETQIVGLFADAVWSLRPDAYR